MAWINVDGSPVHVNTRGQKLTSKDEAALTDFVRHLRDLKLSCEHVRATQRHTDGMWICKNCNTEVGFMRGELESDQPGAFIIEDSQISENKHWMIYNCPCGCGNKGQLSLIKGLNTSHDKHTWGWDGNRRAPTLAPSIRRNIECKFHGHLQKGVWTACNDGPPISPKVWKPS